jgi:hypothetical protein
MSILQVLPFRTRRPRSRPSGWESCRLQARGSASLLVVLLRRRAQEFLPKVRDWMDANSWIVNELVLLLFVAIVISNIA